MRLKLGKSGRVSAFVVLAAVLVLAGVFVATTFNNDHDEESSAAYPTIDHVIDLTNRTITPADTTRVSWSSTTPYTLTFTSIAGDKTYRVMQSTPGTAASVNITFTGTIFSAGNCVVLKDINQSGTITLGVNGTTNADVLFLLEGNNKVNGSIQVQTGRTITIDSAKTFGSSDGSLTVTGNNTNAGIGGPNGTAGGTININGGTITVSANTGAGIGGGQNAAGGTTTITNKAVVNAAASSGAGIGGGSAGSGGSITISGNAVVTATASSGAGIGGGSGSTANGGTIVINGNAKVTATSSSYGAAIGGGLGGSGGIINIGGKAVVNAKSTAIAGGASIGGGGGNGVSGGSGGTITISGNAVVTANSSAAQSPAGIGGGGSSSTSLAGGSGGTINLLGNAIVTASAQIGAGIGGGAANSTSGQANNGAGATLTIDNTVTIKAWNWINSATNFDSKYCTAIHAQNTSYGSGYFVNVWLNAAGHQATPIPTQFQSYTSEYKLRVFDNSGTGGSMMTFNVNGGYRGFAFQFPGATASTTYTIYGESLRSATPVIYTAKVYDTGSAMIPTTNTKAGYDTLSTTSPNMPLLRIEFVSAPLTISTVNEYYLDKDNWIPATPTYIEGDNLVIFNNPYLYTGNPPVIQGYALLGYSRTAPTSGTNYTPIPPYPSWYVGGGASGAGGTHDVIYYVYEESIPYVDLVGDVQTQKGATHLTQASFTGPGPFTLNAGWYFVTEDITLNSYVQINGDVKIIIAD
ncbi:MAG: hypothetical protein FWC44_03725, partial [Methanomassiliicoccaceae archaeon]|nr:hypothetical protein [Methanomassiliicoccaceae archaeon]